MPLPFGLALYDFILLSWNVHCFVTNVAVFYIVYSCQVFFWSHLDGVIGCQMDGVISEWSDVGFIDKAIYVFGGKLGVLQTTTTESSMVLC